MRDYNLAEFDGSAIANFADIIAWEKQCNSVTAIIKANPVVAYQSRSF